MTQRNIALVYIRKKIVIKNKIIMTFINIYKRKNKFVILVELTKFQLRVNKVLILIPDRIKIFQLKFHS